MAQENLALLQEGELSWTPKVNAAINSVNTLNGGGAQRLSDAVVFLAGASAENSYIDYEQHVGYKKVWLVINGLKTSGKNAELVFQIPKSFAPKGVWLNAEANTQSEIVLRDDGKGCFFTTDPDASKGLDSMHLNLSWIRYDN